MAISEAVARNEVDLGLVSVDFMLSRAHHHAAGMVMVPQRLEELEQVATEEKGLHQRGKPGL
ncbi:hypothetical protein [Actinomadura rubrisoli]|uniref:Uncharacterized protein n=1 Tax=Actinomadura rubrisoli TaxID=2530368 RepID=A0A4V2YTF8_9ACTN|nr:hypothetical protein [Actinomadura rubrisoli]TDD73667.1 hypothetical protein E1298_33570 [Actinomadura rubrisoli]